LAMCNFPSVSFSCTTVSIFSLCVGFLGRLYNSLVIRHTELSPELVEEGLIRACAETTGKENRLCYYLGASSDAAAKVTGEVSRPLSAHVPVCKICQRLQRRDGQICELRYGRVYSHIRVLTLVGAEESLGLGGEECRACLEKSEFIDLIQEVAPKHSTAQQRTHSEEF
uniref:Cerebral dopamine neurotrophic factor-like n=1 Tax=Sinocyclocheilus anshuiensis TaxID=1608454 RepID=A0A671SXU6_9TELE